MIDDFSTQLISAYRELTRYKGYFYSESLLLSVCDEYGVDPKSLSKFIDIVVRYYKFSSSISDESLNFIIGEYMRERLMDKR